MYQRVATLEAVTLHDASRSIAGQFTDSVEQLGDRSHGASLDDNRESERRNCRSLRTGVFGIA